MCTRTMRRIGNSPKALSGPSFEITMLQVAGRCYINQIIVTLPLALIHHLLLGLRNRSCGAKHKGQIHEAPWPPSVFMILHRHTLLSYHWIQEDHCLATRLANAVFAF